MLGAAALAPAIYFLVTCGDDFKQGRSASARADDDARQLERLSIAFSILPRAGGQSRMPGVGLSVHVPLWR